VSELAHLHRLDVDLAAVGLHHLSGRLHVVGLEVDRPGRRGSGRPVIAHAPGDRLVVELEHDVAAVLLAAHLGGPAEQPAVERLGGDGVAGEELDPDRGAGHM
jgi:hypothetical protein